MPYKNPNKRKEKQAEYSKKYYEANKNKIKTTTKNVKRTFNTKWKEYKSALSCTQCGENHPATLDFHHFIRDKSNHKVFKLVRNCNWTLLMEELKKCVVLCANCHRKHHHAEGYKKRKKKSAKKKPLNVLI
jgi:hypothetical protein